MSDVPSHVQADIGATLARVRLLLATDRQLGRLYLAGLAADARHREAIHRTGGFAAFHCTQAAIAGHVAAAEAFEAEQRALGFVGPDELAAAELAVEPGPVVGCYDRGHGTTLAQAWGQSPAGYHEARAESRDDRRGKGAYVQAAIEPREWLCMQVARMVPDHDAAVAFVGRWSRVARAVLADPAEQLALFGAP